MILRTVLSVTAVLIIPFVLSSVLASEWYVDDSVTASGNGQTWETAFKTIQEGINAAWQGDTVIVEEGVYVENIRFHLNKGQTIFEEDFEAYTSLYTYDDLVNAGWTVINGSGEPDVAWRLWNTEGEPLYHREPADIAGMTGNYIIANCGYSETASLDEELITPEIDCRDWVKVRLHFDGNYRLYPDDEDHLQIAEVDIRIFDEVSGTWGDWLNLLHLDRTSSSECFEQEICSGTEALDLSGYADGKRIRLRWHFYDAVYDWWFAVDEIVVSGDPASQSTVVSDTSVLARCKNIILRSKDPSNPHVVANTVIDGGGQGPAVSFTGREDETCILAGFTIRNGRAECGGGICGGTLQPHTRATIQDNIVSGNSANEHGGGLAYCDGIIQDNIISDNTASTSGGGLYDCHGIIQNNIVSGNSASAEDGTGGGLSGCSGIMQNNLITQNAGGYAGGALFGCGGTIRNNTIFGNSAGIGGGLASCVAPALSCIIWGNDGGQINDSPPPMFSCIQGWTAEGQGNIPFYPYFVDPAGGNYHLQSWSPCIDTGDPSSPFSEEPEPNGGRINMGAYGNTPEAASKSEDSDNDGLPDEWEIEFLGDLAQNNAGDPDGDLLSNLEEYHRGTDPTTPDEGPVEWYVDGSVAESGDGTSPATAFKTIQEGINGAKGGDTVVVAEWTYVERIQLRGKNITVRSTDPLDPDVVANTVIDGDQGGPVVTFAGMEDETCVLAGLTIRNGTGMTEPWGPEGGGIYGGTRDNHTRATIENNTIESNEGGGIAYCDGTIQNNTISGNSGRYGGALAFSDGTIQSNTIRGNSAEDGAGLNDCNGTIQNNIISGNLASDYGGGLCECQGTIRNNTIVGNGASRHGGGLAYCRYATVVNCIIWGNTAPEDPQLYKSAVPTYSCIQGWTEGGEGNIADDPQFVDPDGLDDDPETFEDNEYHLAAGSPCIDANPDYYSSLWPRWDLDGNCRVVGGLIDMGCYEYGSSLDSDGDLLSDEDESIAGTDPAAEDTDGDGLRDGLEVLRGSDPTMPTPPRIVHVPSDVPTIRECVWFAVHGDEIVVAPGTYRENIVFSGADVILRSRDPHDPGVVSSTIIDGGKRGPVVSFTGRESEACVLAGFTIRNGRANFGAGICGGTWSTCTRATIEHNVITGNSNVDWLLGDGVYASEAPLQSPRPDTGVGGGLYAGNGYTTPEPSAGGGLYACNGLIQDNTVTGNATWGYGGGLAYCDGTIENNTITRNRACVGGGMACCDGILQGNWITANEAFGSYYSGGGLFDCDGIIRTNTISGNRAYDKFVWGGGGLACCDGIIENNTVVGNRGGAARYPGHALGDCRGKIQNCIIWGNGDGSPLSDCSLPTHCCIQYWTEGGEGNVTTDPAFVDADGPDDDPETLDDNDYHLAVGSPCIDAGDNSLLGSPGLDFDGNLRIAFGGKSLTVDMGAYEHNSSPFSVTEIIPDDRGGVQLLWNSQPNNTYVVWSCEDRSVSEWEEEEILFSHGAITWWTDPVTPQPMKVYRIEMK